MDHHGNGAATTGISPAEYLSGPTPATDTYIPIVFRCVREEENKKKEAMKDAVKSMGAIPYFDKCQLDMADAYGQNAKTIQAYLDTLSDEDSD